MNNPKRFMLSVVILVICNCMLIPELYAQFTIKDNLHGNSAGNIILGEDAYFTSGIEDPVNKGWLRLTDDLANLKGYAYINSTFPSTLGVLIDFEYKIWRSKDDNAFHGADGIGIIFFDATSTFKIGQYGGSLGYAPNSKTSHGLAGGYLCIGLDEYGNFSNPDQGRIGGPGRLCNSVTLRGPTTTDPNTTNAWIATNQLQANPSTDGPKSIDYNKTTATRPSDSTFYRRVKISIVPTLTGKYNITVVWRTTPTGIDSILLNDSTTEIPPAKMKVGFTASTGGGYNHHEIRNLLITTPGGVRVDKSVDNLYSKVNDKLTYTINAYNSTTSSITNLIFSDTIKDGLGNLIDLNSNVFTIDSIKYSNNGSMMNKATDFTTGIDYTNGTTYKNLPGNSVFTNPFRAKLNMDANTISTFTVVGTVKNLPSGGGVLSNYVGVDPKLTGITDVDTTNNYFNVSTHVLNVDFVIKNNVDNICADPSIGNAYSLLVSNNGTISSITGNAVTVTDTIPADFTVKSALGNGWNATNTGNVFTFTRSDSLASSGTYPPIIINFNPTLTGTTWVNRATVSYAGIEATTNNNRDSVTFSSKPLPPTVITPLNYFLGSPAAPLVANGNNLLWYTSINGTGSTTVPTPITTALGSTTYYVSQNDGNCESPLSAIVVIVHPIPTTPIVGTTTVCQNSAAPDITFTGVNGIAPFTFTYTVNGGTLQTISSVSGNSVTVSVPTDIPGIFTYHLVNVEDSNAIQQAQNDSAIVTVKPSATATIGGTTTVCQNTTLPDITFTGVGGTAPYTFTYTVNGGSAQIVNTVSGNSVTVHVPTGIPGTFTYNLINVVDSISCSNPQTGSAIITVIPLSTATIGGTISVCQNSTAPLITFAGANGTAPYTFTYAVNGGSVQIVRSISGNSVTVPVPTDVPGIFTFNLISVEDSTTCPQPQSGIAVVTVNSLSTAILGGSTAVFQNSTAPFITFTGTGGSAPYTFTYTLNGGSAKTVITTFGNSVTIPVSTSIPGTFTFVLVGLEDSRLCSHSQTDTAVVTVYSLATATIAGSTSICQNSTSPDITFTGANGIAPYTFAYTLNGIDTIKVSTTSGNNSVTVSVPTITPGTFTYHLISVEDSKAFPRTQSDSAIVIIKPISTATIAGSITVCQNSTSPDIIFTGVGGTAPYTFTYSVNGNNGTKISTTSGSSVTVPAPTETPGTFIYDLLKVEDSKACPVTLTGSAEVTVIPSSMATTKTVHLFTGETYSVNGKVYDKAGIYPDIIKTVNGCDSLIETTVIFKDIPNTITPNVAGSSDWFMKGNHVQIYNRNGILISDGQDGWDGKYKGNLVSQDTYFYVLYYSLEGKPKTKEGYLMVVR